MSAYIEKRAMKENQLLARLPDAEKERLRPYLEPVLLEMKQGLLEEDEAIEYVWFPHDAVTSTVVSTPAGHTIEVGLMGVEGMVGLSLLLGEEKSNTTVFTQIPGHATRMRAGAFVKHVKSERGPLYDVLQRYVNSFMAMIAQAAACNSLHPVDERMCRWILLVHDRVGRNEFPITHEFLSYMLGVRRAGVSKVANELKMEGLIGYTRGEMTILDREGLEARSCECYEFIRKTSESHFR